MFLTAYNNSSFCGKYLRDSLRQLENYRKRSYSFEYWFFWHWAFDYHLDHVLITRIEKE